MSSVYLWLKNMFTEVPVCEASHFVIFYLHFLLYGTIFTILHYTTNTSLSKYCLSKVVLLLLSSSVKT